MGILLLVVWAAIATVGIFFLQSLLREYRNSRRPRSPIPIGVLILVAALVVSVRCSQEIAGVLWVQTVVHDARDVEQHLGNVLRMHR